MEQKILDLLLEINSEIKDIKNEIKDTNLRLDKLEFKMEDGFETLELKIDKLI